MPSKDFCIDAVAKAANIDNIEAAAIIDDLIEYKKGLEAEGDVASAEAIAAEADRLGNEAKLRAALERKNTALAVIRRREATDRITNLVSDGLTPERAVLALLEGSSKRATRGGSLSAYTLHESISNDFTSTIIRQMNESNPSMWDRIRKEGDFNDKVVKEMWEVRTDGKGKPGTTGDKDAVALAAILSDASEKMRQRLNSNGAFIRKLQGWTPQSHNAAKIIKAGFDKWSESIKPLLDFEAMGVDKTDINVFLESVYATLTMGKDSPTVDRVTPRNVARKYGKSRVLHFSNADAQLSYNKEFGNNTDILNTLAAYIDRSSRDVALMETLGPNPEASMLSLVDELNRDVTKDKKISTESIKRRGGAIGNAFAEVSGETMTPENINAANIGRNWRAVQSLSKLGGAALSAVADAGMFALERRTIAERSYIGAMFDTFKDLTTRATDIDREAASRLAVVIDAELADTVQRFNAQDSAQGIIGSAMSKMFKITGLTGWTNARKNGFAILLSKDMGESIGKSWDNLGEGFKEILQQNGNINKTEWDLIRSKGASKIHGQDFLTPDMVSRLDDSSVAAAYGLADDAVGAINRKRVDLETKLRAMFIETTRNAVIEPDAKTRRWMVHGTKPGTAVGETLRTIMQFKSFPFAYTQRILGGRRWRKAGKDTDIVGASMLISNAIALGYLSMTLKDLAKGRTPKDPRKKETIIAATLQSGGLGIFGDFLIGEANRFGGSFASTAGGPSLGTAEALVNITRKVLQGDPDIGSESVSLAQSNLPFANMWFIKTGLDYLVWFHLREMTSPGAMRRMERRMKKDYNQQYILPPTKVVR